MNREGQDGPDFDRRSLLKAVGVAGGLVAGAPLLSEEVSAAHNLFLSVSPNPATVGQTITLTVSHNNLCGVAEVSIDWGDETSTRANTEGTLQVQHIYRSAGEYTITVESCEGTWYCQGDCTTRTTTVTVTGDEPENTPPVAGDDSYATTMNTTLEVPAPGVLLNDTDADEDALSVSMSIDPTNGSVTLNADGSFTYVPKRGFTGTDSFVYELSDGTATDSAIVSIGVASPAPQGPPC